MTSWIDGFSSEGTPHMFGIGYQEMFIVLVVALVIFGPSRLPELAGQVGRWVRDFRRMSSDLTGEFEKTFAEVDEVKKTFKREMQSIQDEVEGVGKSARGDLKKSGAKSISGGKGAGSAAAKTGTRTGASIPSTVGASSLSASNSAATGTTANGASAKMTGRAGKLDANAAATALPIATKADPLADVSFFDLDAELAISKNGSTAAATGATADGDDALSRVRRRRAAAGYARQKTA